MQYCRNYDIELNYIPYRLRFRQHRQKKIVPFIRKGHHIRSSSLTNSLELAGKYMKTNRLSSTIEENQRTEGYQNRTEEYQEELADEQELRNYQISRDAHFAGKGELNLMMQNMVFDRKRELTGRKTLLYQPDIYQYRSQCDDPQEDENEFCAINKIQKQKSRRKEVSSNNFGDKMAQNIKVQSKYPESQCRQAIIFDEGFQRLEKRISANKLGNTAAKTNSRFDEEDNYEEKQEIIFQKNHYKTFGLKEDFLNILKGHQQELHQDNPPFQNEHIDLNEEDDPIAAKITFIQQAIQQEEVSNNFKISSAALQKVATVEEPQTQVDFPLEQIEMEKDGIPDLWNYNKKEDDKCFCDNKVSAKLNENYKKKERKIEEKGEEQSYKFKYHLKKQDNLKQILNSKASNLKSFSQEQNNSSCRKYSYSPHQQKSLGGQRPFYSLKGSALDQFIKIEPQNNQSASSYSRINSKISANTKTHLNVLSLQNQEELEHRRDKTISRQKETRSQSQAKYDLWKNELIALLQKKQQTNKKKNENSHTTNLAKCLKNEIKKDFKVVEKGKGLENYQIQQTEQKALKLARQKNQQQKIIQPQFYTQRQSTQNNKDIKHIWSFSDLISENDDSSAAPHSYQGSDALATNPYQEELSNLHPSQIEGKHIFHKSGAEKISVSFPNYVQQNKVVINTQPLNEAVKGSSKQNIKYREGESVNLKSASKMKSQEEENLLRLMGGSDNLKQLSSLGLSFKEQGGWNEQLMKEELENFLNGSRGHEQSPFTFTDHEDVSLFSSTFKFQHHNETDFNLSQALRDESKKKSRCRQKLEQVNDIQRNPHEGIFQNQSDEGQRESQETQKIIQQTVYAEYKAFGEPKKDSYWLEQNLQMEVIEELQSNNIVSTSTSKAQMTSRSIRDYRNHFNPRQAIRRFIQSQSKSNSKSSQSVSLSKQQLQSREWNRKVGELEKKKERWQKNLSRFNTRLNKF